uniref:Uncharacterized protein, contains caspase domain n=1 Tax=Candidatus Kentrum sp. MB TaxID=2138164 RepID=A0A450XI20_9GAMM|nr:MAG: Uncharacterized protein, contains caspase domain [Candidatus Kentron sp. MB]VFK28899.1 MAG: Uncharacterized protein, contains caspase domain [Candidatus Kentron sp. MB]VFK74146.1 MAG: Uncharacterized protein, contains caspase domain [Candidatus Kentron sp. MB]
MRAGLKNVIGIAIPVPTDYPFSVLFLTHFTPYIYVMDKYALLIGVSQYPDGAFRPLPAAVNDARAMRSVLIHPEMGGFSEENVTLLEDTGRVEMEAAIERLFAEAKSNDLALFYFSGHGIKDDTGQLYLATFETRKYPNGALSRATAVPAAAVRDNMDRSRCQRQVVILDSCFSEPFPEGIALKDDGSLHIGEQLVGEGRAVFVASTNSRYALGKEGEELSLYTRFLVRGIETGEADRDEDGIITIMELHDYIGEKVQEVQPAMQPGLYSGEGSDTIPLARVPVSDPLARYAEAVADALDRRGEITITGRASLDQWRRRMGLDVTSYEAIERKISAERQAAFQERANEYTALFRGIRETGEPLRSEVAQLNERREALGLEPEDVREIEAGVEKELAVERERHEKDRQMYAASLREAIRLEGETLTESTQARLTRFQWELGLSDAEVVRIRDRVRWEKSKPPGEAYFGFSDKGRIIDVMLIGTTGIMTIVAIALALWVTFGMDDVDLRRLNLRPEGSPVSITTAGSPAQVADEHTKPGRMHSHAQSGNEKPVPPARLVVRSNVSGDSVTIDGNPVGASGPEAHELPAGKYTVRVEKAGFGPFEAGVELTAGKERTVSARLEKLPPDHAN